MRGIVAAGLEDIGDNAFRQEAGVFGEETENDAIKETRNAQVLALGYRMLPARLRVDQLDALALL